jgi:hypothetical protein
MGPVGSAAKTPQRWFSEGSGASRGAVMTIATQPVVKTGFEVKVQKVLSGLEKFLPADSSLVLNGKSWKQPELIQSFQAAQVLFTAVRDEKATLKQKLLDRRSGLVQYHELYVALGKALQGYFGRGSAALAELGFSQGQRKPRSGQVNTLARAKAKLTRAARHTMGSKQKLAIVAPGSPTLVLFGPDGKPIEGEVPSTAPPGLTGSGSSTNAGG